MIRNTHAPHTLAWQGWQAQLHSRVLVMTTLVLMLAASLATTATAQAAMPAHTTQGHVSVQPIPTPTVRADTQLVFSVGTLTKVEQQTVTLSFDDGKTETYQLVPATAVQTQNGDAQAIADLDVGAMVVVIADETDFTALTIVNGGAAGFHEAGPADIRGHADACAACEPAGSPPPAALP